MQNGTALRDSISFHLTSVFDIKPNIYIFMTASAFKKSWGLTAKHWQLNHGTYNILCMKALRLFTGNYSSLRTETTSPYHHHSLDRTKSWSNIKGWGRIFWQEKAAWESCKQNVIFKGKKISKYALPGITAHY